MTLQAVPNVKQVITDSPTVSAVVDSATVAVVTANTAINAAESATVVAAMAQAAVDSQTVVVAVDSATVVSATIANNTAQTTLTTLQNTPTNSNTYTTPGYVAPAAVDSPTVTTTVLPQMYDAATKIQTPFDIKLGNTLYEGQGSASQIYVTSKATITFGSGDYNWWDFPNTPSISVFGSDFMNAGPKDRKSTRLNSSHT